MFFKNTEYFYWFFILLILVLLYIFRVLYRNKKIKKWLGKQDNSLRFSISNRKRSIKIVLKFFVLIFVILALARPQGLGEKIELPNKGISILLLVDISNSMLVEDVLPSRLDFLKKELNRLLDLSSGDQVALAFFANSSVLASPFTNDLTAIKSYLNDLSVDYLSNQGTNFERAFQLSAQVFEGLKQKESALKVILLASDGEDHSAKTYNIIKSLVSEEELRIFTLSVGTQKGGIIPIRDYKNNIKEYKKDSSGKLVISRLQPESLKNFAKWGKGSYYHLSYGSQSIEKLKKDLDTLKKSEFEKNEFIQKKEYYQWFLLVAFFLALFELLLNDRKLSIREN
ncbi:MAG: VWA domain-containing protein [Bdellovibrionaceae bacterium]|nr:VWA domain-containing protein [Pseudobdellovibrionaceae bacterium]